MIIRFFVSSCLLLAVVNMQAAGKKPRREISFERANSRDNLEEDSLAKLDLALDTAKILGTLANIAANGEISDEANGENAEKSQATSKLILLPKHNRRKYPENALNPVRDRRGFRQPTQIYKQPQCRRQFIKNL